MRADSATESAVRGTLDRFFDAYARRDLAALDQVFAPDPDVLLYGTGPDEKRKGLEEIRAQAQRDWAQSESSELVLGDTTISAAGAVAWTAGDAKFRVKAGGRSMEVPARVTSVLERRDGKWVIVHWHASVPAADQPAGRSFPQA